MADTTISSLNTVNALSAVNYIPVSDGTNTTKLGTDSLFGFRNRIINGGMRINQRGGTTTFSGTGTTTYGLDRCRGTASGSGSWTMQQSTDVPTGAGFTNSMQINVTTAATSIINNDCYYFAHLIEGNNIADLGWGTAGAKTVTISFWVKSSITGSYSIALMNTEFTRSYLTTYTINSANTWERKVITMPGDVGATSIVTDNGIGMGIVFDFGFAPGYETTTTNSWLASPKYAIAGQTKIILTQNATWRITGLQLEEGSTATPFEWRQYGTELALCQRYFHKQIANVDVYLCGYNGSFATTMGYYYWGTPMRIAPIITGTTNAGGNGGPFGFYQFLTGVCIYSPNGSLTCRNITANAEL